jgi:hypothetical protein
MVTVVCAYHYLLLLCIYVIADDVMHLLVVCVQAREGLNVVTVVCANNAYNILKLEMALQVSTSETVLDTTFLFLKRKHETTSSGGSAFVYVHAPHTHTKKKQKKQKKTKKNKKKGRFRVFCPGGGSHTKHSQGLGFRV